MKKFKEIDLGNDGFITFLEFFRACCAQRKIYLPDPLTFVDKLKIYQCDKYEHIY